MATILVPDSISSRRFRFVATALHQRYGQSNVVWVTRRPVAEEKFLAEDFDRHFPGLVADWQVIPDLPSFRAGIPQVRAALESRPGPLVGMGFVSLALGRAVGSVLDVWVPRGIPEELGFYERSPIARARIWSRWRLARHAGPAPLAIATSAPMAHLLSERTRVRRVVAIPNAVDVARFRPPAQGAPERTHLTYLGSGAPWQAVDVLHAVWSELARLDPELRFRVISRDDRTEPLITALGDRAERVSGTNATVIATYLWQASAGFVLRRPNLVNEVSWPVKIGEYMAAGVPVVTTSIAWDPGDFVRDTCAGIAVPPSDSPREIAARVLDLLAAPPTAGQLARAAAELDSDLWLERLVAMLP